LLGQGLRSAPPAASAPAARTSAASVGLWRARLLRHCVCWLRFLLWSHAYIKVP
jgi:hypothetical protein